ncbi:MAG: hypothetical protein R6X21_03530, partial [Candidatus Aminicenantes bacterium]
MKFLKTVLPLTVLLLVAACSFYEARPKLNYYRGPNVPEGYIKVLRASVSEIEFEIRVSSSKGSSITWCSRATSRWPRAG